MSLVGGEIARRRKARTSKGPGASIPPAWWSRLGYLPVEPIVNVPTFRNGTSRVPTGVRTSTVPCAR